MIGRGAATDIEAGGPTYLEVVGLRRLSQEFGDWFEAVNAKEPTPFVFNYEYDAPGHPEQYYCRADHYSYARYGIPSVSLSRGSHMDYHQLTDEPQYIDYPDYARLTQLVFDGAVFVANAEHAPRLTCRSRRTHTCPVANSAAPPRRARHLRAARPISGRMTSCSFRRSRRAGSCPFPAVWSDPTRASGTRSTPSSFGRAGTTIFDVAEFVAWLAALESARVPVFNSPAIIRWNADKRYLLDLARHGVATIPTMIVEGGGADAIVRVGCRRGVDALRGEAGRLGERL